MAKLNVKKGDAVIVIAGKDKGQSGQITKVDTEKGRVTVEGINIVHKHVKPKKAQQKGGIVKQPSSIDCSNVMIVCSSCNLPTRIGKKEVEENGKQIKIRICKKCGESLEVNSAKTKSTVKKATKKKKADTTKAKAEKEVPVQAE